MKKLLIISCLILSLTACNSENFTIKVKNSERITSVSNGTSSGYYLIFTDKGVFKNGDNFFVFKFDSSDIQNKIQKDNCYKVKTRFWRVPFLSMYKNIMSLKKIECKKPINLEIN